LDLSWLNLNRTLLLRIGTPNSLINIDVVIVVFIFEMDDLNGYLGLIVGKRTELFVTTVADFVGI
jgi:hypothetical protein